jgi:hypothetical protein
MEIGRGLEKERRKQFRYVKDMFELVAKNLSAVPSARVTFAPERSDNGLGSSKQDKV